MAFASVTFKECGLYPSFVHNNFEYPWLPNYCEPNERVDTNQ